MKSRNEKKHLYRRTQLLYLPKVSGNTGPSIHTRTWPVSPSRRSHCKRFKNILWNQHHSAITPNFQKSLFNTAGVSCPQTFSKQNHRLHPRVTHFASHPIAVQSHYLGDGCEYHPVHVCEDKFALLVFDSFVVSQPCIQNLPSTIASNIGLFALSATSSYQPNGYSIMVKNTDTIRSDHHS